MLHFKLALIISSLFATSSAIAAPLATNALPTGGVLIAGQAVIAQSGNVMNINQSSQNAVINWNSFNVGSSAKVNFNQPNSNSATLNVVNGSSKSMIDGAVNANGQVIFTNQNGVVFGKNAEVNVGGMVATTMNINQDEFMSGNMKQTYSGNVNSSAKVINKGKITGNNINSYIALMAPEVRNEGIITATLSGANAIALVSGQKVTLTFNDQQLVNVYVDASSINSLIQNKRLIQVEGGNIIIAANSAQALRNSVVQNSGTISASGINKEGGVITLVGNKVVQAGIIESNSTTSTGGQINITGNEVNLTSQSQTTATGTTGGGQIFIGKSNNHSSLTQVNAKTVIIDKGAVIDVSASKNGNGGMIQVWSEQVTTVAGALSAKGGLLSGNGGTIDNSSVGKVIYGTGLLVDTTAPKGKIGNWITQITIDQNAASVISNALITTNVTLDATLASCGGFGTCVQSSVPSITFLAGADIFSQNQLTSLSLNAVAGTININNNITAGAVYAVAQAINVNGSINTNGGSSSNIYLAGAMINLLGNINSNGNGNNSGSNNSTSLNLSNANTGNNRRNGQNGLIADNVTYTSSGGTINVISSGDINVGSNSYISANGINGGTINIVSTSGNVNNNGIIDSIGKVNNGGNVAIVGKTQTDIIGALISSEGLSQGGVINLGQINNLSNGSTLAPPATAPPSLIVFVNNAVVTAVDSNNSITSSIIKINSQSAINSPNGKIVVFGNQIQINHSSITTTNGSIAIGRQAFAKGALSSSTFIFNSNLTGTNVETSGEALSISGVNVHASGEWLLDPTNVTISAATTTGGVAATGSNYNANIAAFAAQAGVSNINTADIQNAINAGTSVTISATGTITQSAALTFANSTAPATLTIDNTSGTAQNISLAAITTTGTATTSLVVKASGTISATGAITASGTGPLNVSMQSFYNSNAAGSGSGANIYIVGNITTKGGFIALDGTGGSISAVGVITKGTIVNGTVALGSGGVVFNTTSTATTSVSSNTTGGNFAVTSSNSLVPSFGPNGAWYIGGSVDINTYATGTALWGGFVTNLYSANSPIAAVGNLNITASNSSGSTTSGRGIIDITSTLTSYAGSVNLTSTGTGSSTAPGVNGAAAISGATGVNIINNNLVGTGVINTGTITSSSGPVTINSNSTSTGVAVNQSGNISAGAGVTITGTSATATTVVNLGSATITNTTGNIAITGNDSAAGSNTGISSTGAINQSANGGTILFTSNNIINQTGAITLAANTSGTISSVTYDTTSGNKSSAITTGALTLTGGMSASNTAINYTVITSGAPITVGAVTVPGYILLDNTYGGASPVSGGVTQANATTGTAVTVGGALTSGAYAGGNAITINAIAGTAGVGINDSLTTNNLTAIVGNISLNSTTSTGAGITYASPMTATSGSVSITGTSTTGATIVATGAITGLGISVNGTATTAATITSLGAMTVNGLYVAGTNAAPSFISNTNGTYIGTIATLPTLTSAAIAGTNAGLTGNIQSATVVYAMAGNTATNANYLLGWGAAAAPLTRIVQLNLQLVGGQLIATELAAKTSVTALTTGAGTNINTLWTGGTVATTQSTSLATAGYGIANIGFSGSPVFTNSASGDIVVNGTGTAGGNTGITQTGAITQNASGGNITFTSNNKIAQAGAITLVANTSGTSSAITYDTTSGNQNSTIATGALSLGAGTSSSAINYVVKSSGSALNIAATSVPGSILVDNTNNGVTLAANATTGTAITVSGALTSGSLAGANAITLKAIAGTAGIGINDAAATDNLTASVGNISLISTTSTGAGITYSSPITATSGNVILTGTSTTGATIATTGLITANSITVTGNATTAATVVSLGAMTINAGGGDISVTGNDSTAGANNGITQTGAITDNASGGNISFISNNKIAQSGAIALVANASGTAANVTYDTTSGNYLSILANGAISITGSSTSPINFIAKTNGAAISSTAITMPGYIRIDNTCYGCTTAGVSDLTATNVTATNATALSAITLGGNLTSGAGIYLNGINSGTAVVNSLGAFNLTVTSAATFPTADVAAISVIANHKTSNVGNPGISSTGTVAIQSSGGDLLFQSNGDISLTGALNLAANNTNHAQSIKYDTTSGNGGSAITIQSISSQGASITAPINVSILSNSTITINGSITQNAPGTSAAPINILAQSFYTANTYANFYAFVGGSNNIDAGKSQSAQFITRGGYVVLDGTGGTISGLGTPGITNTMGSIQNGVMWTHNNLQINTTNDGLAVSASTTGGGNVILTTSRSTNTMIPNNMDYGAWEPGANQVINAGGTFTANIRVIGPTGIAYTPGGFATSSPINALGDITLTTFGPGGASLSTPSIYVTSPFTSYTGSVNLTTSLVTPQLSIKVGAAISAATGVNLTASGGTNIGVSSVAGGTITTTGGSVNIISTNSTTLYGVSMGALITAPKVVITATNPNLTGEGISVTGGITISALDAGLANTFVTAADALTLTSTVGTNGIAGGITVTTGAITNNSNGGNVSYITNGDITSTAAISFATANTTNHAQIITYDTTTGNLNSKITTGAFTFNSTGATSPVNFIEKSNGSALTIGATSVSGSILVDNTNAGSTLAANATTGTAITVNGALSSGSLLLGSDAIVLKAIAGTAGIGINDAAATDSLTAPIGNISLTSTTSTGAGITYTSPITATSGSVSITGTSTTGATIAATGAITGLGISVNGTATTAATITSLGAMTVNGLYVAGTSATPTFISNTTGSYIGTISSLPTLTSASIAGANSGLTGNIQSATVVYAMAGNTATNANYLLGWGAAAAPLTRIVQLNLQLIGGQLIATELAARTSQTALTTGAGTNINTLWTSGLSATTQSTSLATVGYGVANIGFNGSPVFTNAASGNIVVNGTGTAGANTGITQTGAITQNVNGGNVTFTSNNKIAQSGAITFVANTSGNSSAITYDTRSGTYLSTIANGVITVNGSSTSAINFVALSNGAAITATALTMPGYIRLDNTCYSCTTVGISDLTAANASATNATALSAITLAGNLTSNVGIYLNGINASTTVVNALGAFNLTVTNAASFPTADVVAISVIGNHNTANAGNPGISTSGTIAVQSSGGDILFKSNGDISQTGTITLAANNTGNAQAITFDTTLGSLNAAITTGTITNSASATPSNNPVNLFELSSGSAITLGTTTISGSVTLDNTYGGTGGVGGSPTSGYLLIPANVNASNVSATGHAAYIPAGVTAGIIAGRAVTMNLVSRSTGGTFYTNGSILSSQQVSGYGININIYAAPTTGGLAMDVSGFGVTLTSGTASIAGGDINFQANSTGTITSGQGNLDIIAYGGNVNLGNITTPIVGATSGIVGVNITVPNLKNITATTVAGVGGNVNIYVTSNGTGSAIRNSGTITADANVVINAQNTSPTSTSSQAVLYTGLIKSNNGSINIQGTTAGTGAAVSLGALMISGGSGNITVTGNNAIAGGNVGITQTGAITDNSIGGNISFISNSIINQSGAISVVANSSGHDANIIFDTTTGTKLSTINPGVVTFGAGASNAYINYANITAGAEIIQNGALNVPGSITLDNTYINGVQGAITASNAWQYATTANNGISISSPGNMTATNGIYIRGAVGAATAIAQPTKAAVLISNVTLATTGTFVTGTDAINIVGIMPSANTSTSLYAIGISGNVAINNNSTGGNTNIIAYSGRYYDAVTVTNGANAGAISLTAIGNIADIVTVAGTLFTQNSNAGVFIATSNNGNVTPPKIVNNGTGPVVIEAGAYFGITTVNSGGAICTAITTNCGQITAISGNNITSPNGNVYLYAGSPGTTAVTMTTPTSLAFLSPTLGTLSLGNTLFGQAYAAGNVASTGLPITSLAGINASNVVAGTGKSSWTTTSANGPVIQFRTQPTVAVNVSGQMTKVYGVDDPLSTAGNVTTAGTLDYQLNSLFVKNSTANPAYIANGVSGCTNAAGCINVAVNGLNFVVPLSDFINTLQSTSRVSYGTLLGEQVNGTSPTVYTGSYAYTLSSTSGVAVSSGISLNSNLPVNGSVTGLVITPASLTITANNQTTQSGSAANLGSTSFTTSSMATVVDGVTLPTISGVTLAAATYTTPYAVGTYPIAPSAATFTTAAGSIGASNYSITYTNGTLTAAAGNVITITAINDSKIYGNSFTATNGLTYNGSGIATFISGVGYLVTGTLPVGDTLTGLTITSLGGVVSANVGNSYVITPSNAIITGSTPVTVNYVNGLMSVTPRPITISATAINTTYGTQVNVSQSNPTGYSLSSGSLASGDTISSVAVNYNNGISNSVTIPSNTAAGNYVGAILASSAIGTGGFNANNYNITYNPAALTVNKANLTITGNTTTPTYNGSTQTNTYVVTGLVNGETITATGAAQATHVSPTATADNLVAVAGAGTSLSNYSITTTNGSIQVTPLAITGTAQVNGKVYDGTTAGTGAITLSGVLSADQASTTATGTYTFANANAGVAKAATVSGVTINNTDYSVTVVPSAGTATISAAPLTITGNTTTPTYNGSTQTNTYVVAGLVNGETITATGAAQATHVSPTATADNLVAVAGAGTSLSNYSITTTNGSIQVTPLAITGTAQVNGKVYDGTTAGTGAITLSGVLSADQASTTATGTYTFANANAGVAKAATVSGVTINNTDYSVTVAPSAGTATISAAPLTIIGNTTTPTYNGSAQTNTYVVTGLVNGETITATGAAQATHVSPTATADNLVAVAGAGTSLSNYSITTTNGSIQVTPLAITGTAQVNGKVYDGTTAGTGAITLSGVLSADQASTTATGTYTFANANAGVAKAATVSGVTINNTDYSVTVVPSAGTATISAAPLTITGNTTTPTYNGSAQTNTYVVTGLVNGETITATGAAQATHVSPTATADNLVAVAGAGTSLSNYSITTTNGSIQVSPLAITGTAQVNGKVYDGTTVGTGTITLTGLLPADVGSTSASGTFTFANSNAGTKAATVSGVTVNNADYSITVPASAGNATITTAALTITGGTTTTSFDNTTHTNTYSITSGALFGSDVISSVNGLGSGLHANTYTDSGLSASGTGLSNYAISYVPGSLTINPATFTAAITPNVATYTGTNVIANTTVLTGAMNGVTITATTSLTTSGINAGIQTIINNGTTLSGANAGDYVITSSTILNNGGIGAANNQVIPGSGPNNSGSTIVIVPKTLTITGNTTTPTYNGSTQTNTYVVTGLVNGETITASGAAQATHVSPTATADNLVAVAGAGTSLSNYSITTTNGSIQVTPLAITGTAQVNGKVYNGTTVGTGTIILTGVLPADVASTTATGTYTFANANAGAAKAATVSGVTINNTDYSVTVAPSAGTATITAAALTISGNTTTGTFDNTTHTNTYSITSGSLFGSDVINSVSGLGGGLHANTYSDSGLSANGTGLSNYTISYVPGSLTINPATLTAAVTPSVATYNGSNVLANATVLSGVISGTTVSGTTSLTVSATNAGTQTITNNGTTLSGANAGDYVIASTSIANNGGVGAANNQVIPGTGPNNTGSTIVIVPKTLTITGNTTTPTYNGSAQTNTYVVTGLVNGETITATGAAQATHVSPTATADNLVAVAGAGTSLSNYSITTTNGSIQVTPLAITGTAQVNGKVYDGTTAGTGAITLSGVLSADQASTTASGTYTFANANAGVAKAATVSGVTINNTDYSVTVAPSAGSATITTAPLTITGNTTTPTYNGSTQTNTYVVAGLVNGETITATGAAQATHVSPTATADNLVAVAGAGTSLSNYSITTTNGSIQVSPLAITGTAQVNGKVYDGTTVGTGTITLTGLLPADVGSTSASGTFTFANSNAGTKAATVSGVTVNNADYSITVPASAGNATITAAALTITGGTTTTTFDNTTHTNTYSITSGALFGSDAISSVSGLGSGLHANTYIDSALSANGTGLSNYAISYVPGSLTINPATLSASVTPTVATYNGTNILANATVLSGVISGTTVSGTTSLTLSATNAGTQTITNNGTTLSGANAGDYVIASTSIANNGGVGAANNQVIPGSGPNNTGSTIVIVPKTLTITGNTTTPTYNGSAQTNTYVVTGVVGGETITATGSAQATNVAQGVVTDSLVPVAGTATALSNYSITTTNGSIQVTPLAITGTAQVNGKVYDGTTAGTGVITLSGVLSADQASTSASGNYTFVNANAGTQFATVSNTIVNNNNYSITVPSSAGTATINPAALTITGNVTTPTYNGNLQTNTYTVAGLVNGEMITASGSAQATHVAQGSISDNLVPVAGTGSLSNYSITTTNGSIQVSPLAITGSAQVNGKVYNGTTAGTGTITLTGVLPADVGSTSASGTFTFANANAGTKAATVSGVTVNNTDYSVTVAPSAGTATITTAALTITGSTTTTTFDNTTHTNTYSITSGALFGSDAISSVSGLGSGLHANTYTDSSLSASGTGLSNYAISYVPGSLTINPASLTAAVTPNVGTYSGTNVLANNTVLTGVINGTTVNGSTSLTLSGTNVGTQTIANNGTTLSGANAGDYVITSSIILNNGGIGAANNQVIPGTGPNNTGSTIVIVPKTLTITGNTTTPTYNGSAQTNTYVVTGLVNGETITATGAAQATHVSPTATADNLVAVAGAGTSLSNYSITTTNGSIQVTPLAITGTAQVNGKVYDGTTAGTGAITLSGVLSADQASTTATGTYTFANANAGVAKAATVSGVTINNTDYSVTVVPSAGTATISAAPLTITGNTTTPTYNGSAQTNTYVVTGLVNGETITATGAAQATHVSPTATADNLVAVAGAGTSLSNYSITTTNGSIQVSPLAITGTAQVNGKVYDGTTVGTGTITLTGLLPADVGSTSASGTFTFANSNAGTKAATVSGVTVNNADYSITVPASAGNATITTAALTITGGTTTTSFDNTTHTNTYSITSGALFGSDVISSVNGLGSGLHANTYTDSGLSASGTGLSNYAISYVPGSLTINPATLSATVTPLVKVYDGTSNISNATALIGVISGTSVSATTSLSLLGSNSGTQTITNNGTTLSGPNAGDYLIVNSSLINNGSNGITPNNAGGNGNHGGTIFINPAPLTITGTKVYDGSANFTYLNMSVSGALNGEKISLITGNAITPSSNAGNYVGTNIINLTIAVAGGNALPSNYQLPSSGTFNVDPAPITNTGSPLTYRAVVTGTLTTAAPSVVGLGAGLGNPNSVIVQMVNNPITNATALPSQNTNANTTANANSANPPIVGNTRTRTQAASTNNRAKSQSSILANNRNKAAGIGNRNTRRNSSANANANQQNNINSNIANFARPGDAGRFVGKGDFTTRSNTYASTRNGLSEVRDRSNSGDTVAKPKNSGGGCGGGKSNTGAVVSTNRSCSQLKAPGDPLANSYHHMEWPGANKSYTGSSAKSIGTIDYNKKMNMNFMINLIILF